jgi:antitoxin component of MazEF toxin-antitoxin module
VSFLVKADTSGAVTLPAELCQEAGLAPGAELVAEIEDGRIIVTPARPALAERIVARARALAPEVLEGLPDDLAAQHDHYLYGLPKRPE